MQEPGWKQEPELEQEPGWKQEQPKMLSQQMVQHQQLLHIRLGKIHLLDQLRLQLQFQSYLRCRHHHLRLHLQPPLRPSHLHLYLHGTPAMVGKLLLRRRLNNLRRYFHLLIRRYLQLLHHPHLQLHLAPKIHSWPTA